MPHRLLAATSHCFVTSRLVSRRPHASFRDTIITVEIHRSARKHGVSDESIRHAFDHALSNSDASEDPYRLLILGPDTAGNMLEVVVIVRGDDDVLAIHADRMGHQYDHLLP